jgi:hypothetical protein
MTDDLMTLSEAHMKLLDHVGERVDVGIMLPGGTPWAGGQGVLDHQAQRLIGDLADTDWVRRRWAELLLQRAGRDGLFMVGDFVVPLHAECVSAVHRKANGYAGLDFTVGALTVRVTFTEHAQNKAKDDR